MSLGERIHEARKAAGLTQKELGQKMGVSHAAVGGWERGESKNLRLENLFNLEDITGYSARWISTGEGNKLVAAAPKGRSVYYLSDRESAIIEAYRQSENDDKADSGPPGRKVTGMRAGKKSSKNTPELES
jgi:transcriptional regulator with XRE-family HTH domain